MTFLMMIATVGGWFCLVLTVLAAVILVTITQKLTDAIAA